MPTQTAEPHHPRNAPSLPLTAHWRELPFAVETTEAFHALYGASEVAFWLDSARPEDSRSRWSFMGDAAGPLAAVVSYDAAGRRLTLRDSTGISVETESIFAYLERSRTGTPAGAPPCPFVGGHVGWLGYELRGECCQQTLTRRAATPDAFFIRADRFLAVDHLEHRTYVVALYPAPRCSSDRGQLAPAPQLAAAKAWVDATVARLEHLRRDACLIAADKHLRRDACLIAADKHLPPLPEPVPGNRRAPVVFRLNRDRAAYLADIRQSLDWIGEGQTYQVCLTNELTCELETDLFGLYCTLRRINPAPFAAFIRWPGGTVLGASPERFLSVDANGLAEAKPIKGTIRRDPDPEIDRALAHTLASSEKDRAENLMIVDLLRNDLSRVCEVGSVVVPSLMAVESFATVHQLVSTVQGRLRPEFSAIDLIKAAFPGGSMTGAPKIHTLELIDRLEGRARGIYSGALGWIGDDGAMDLNIVIRTIVAQWSSSSEAIGQVKSLPSSSEAIGQAKSLSSSSEAIGQAKSLPSSSEAIGQQKLSIGVGGGIVADSQPGAEFDEMLLKARALMHAIVLTATGGFDEDRYRIEGG